MPRIPFRRRVSGVTLMELLIAIAIVAVLTVVALPNLTEMFIANRLTAAAGDFIAALADARSEAMRRGAPVSLVSTAGGQNWGAGWTLCVDADAATPAGACATAANSVLRRGEALAAPLTLYANATFAKAVTFDGMGRATASSANGASLPSYPGLFVLCHGGVFAESGKARSRAILVNAVGRIRAGLDANGNGIPEGDGTTDIGGNCTAPTP